MNRKIVLFFLTVLFAFTSQVSHAADLKPNILLDKMAERVSELNGLLKSGEQKASNTFRHLIDLGAFEPTITQQESFFKNPSGHLDETLFMASRKNLPTYIFETLTKNKSPLVKTVLARHIHLPLNLQVLLSKDSDLIVRSFIAQRADLKSEVFEQFLNEPQLAMLMTYNSDIPLSRLQEIEKFVPNHFKFMVTSRINSKTLSSSQNNQNQDVSGFVTSSFKNGKTPLSQQSKISKWEDKVIIFFETPHDFPGFKRIKILNQKNDQVTPGLAVNKLTQDDKTIYWTWTRLNKKTHEPGTWKALIESSGKKKGEFEFELVDNQLPIGNGLFYSTQHLKSDNPILSNVSVSTEVDELNNYPIDDVEFLGPGVLPKFFVHTVWNRLNKKTHTLTVEILDHNENVLSKDSFMNTAKQSNWTYWTCHNFGTNWEDGQTLIARIYLDGTHYADRIFHYTSKPKDYSKDPYYKISTMHLPWYWAKKIREELNSK